AGTPAGHGGAGAPPRPAAAAPVRAAWRTLQSRPTLVVRGDGHGPGHIPSGADRTASAEQTPAALPSTRSPPDAGQPASRAQALRVIRGRACLSGLRPCAYRHRYGPERTTRLPARVVDRH